MKMEVIFNIPDSLIPEFQSIAHNAGFANAKDMVRSYLKYEIQANRENQIRTDAQIEIDMARELAAKDAEAIS